MATGFRKTLFILLTCHLLLLLPRGDSKCPRSYPCRNFTLEFPFTDANHPGCGLIQVQDCSNSSQHQHPTVEVGGSTGYLHLISILGKMSENSFLVEDLSFQNVLYTRKCIALQNMDDYLPNTPSVAFTFSPNITCYSCYRGPHIADHFKNFDKQECEYTDLYYERNSSSHHLPTGEIPPGCRKIQLPSKPDPRPDDHTLFNLTTATFSVEWHVSKACLKCYNGGGQCLTDTQNNTFHCRKDKSRLKVILALSLSGAGLLLLLSITFLIWLRKKNSSKKNLISRNISSHTSSKSDIEGGIFYFGIPVFSRTELEKATNNFDASKQLGDGGFGTVYHGTLLDGREVAVKRLYEHNFRREEQFLNEIKILTSLRHPNLVSLYGCTSRRSQELLLVYEYISNGTVADHLHGERAAESPLSWPVRMSIAIETATALAYLHKSDIIHRDVKTTNILLDKKFSVKVTDFGLSRLFPDNVTHVSTCPQGTPGYVDPEYYQCYQLTDKSGVYSFGVVLIELISSMPAVDVSRHRHEINLANLAMNRIQRGVFNELIDPSLGYDSDLEVTRMTTAVAGLAFGCLQHDKDLRPSMDEVLSFLKDIEGGEDCNTGQMTSIGASPEREDDVLLRNNKLLESSPNAVTDAWVSSASSTTSFT